MVANNGKNGCQFLRDQKKQFLTVISQDHLVGLCTFSFQSLPSQVQIRELGTDSDLKSKAEVNSDFYLKLFRQL